MSLQPLLPHGHYNVTTESLQCHYNVTSLQSSRNSLFDQGRNSDFAKKFRTFSVTNGVFTIEMIQ